jgi:hypothetical protein
MSFEAAKAAAERHLIQDASLDELRRAAQDLRSLTPDSALADAVEAKIREILGSADEDDTNDAEGV